MAFQRSLLSIFPPPKFLSMPAAGIDISRGSVKCVFLKGYGSKLELKSFGETPLPDGVVVDGDIEQKERVVEVLRSFRLRYGVKSAHACLPEKKAYLYKVLIPGNSNLKAGVEFDFETHVPLPPGEAIFDYEPIRKVEAGTIVAVTAYAKRIVNQYMSVFTEAGITPRSFEVESQALARAAVRARDRKKVIMMIDFGRKTTRIAIVEYGVVAFTATVDIGGDTLTAAVMKLFNVPEPEAEEIKNNRGFLMNKDNKNLVEALMITVSVMRDEIVKHLAYWNNPTVDDLPRKPVEKIIMCGGNANLRGFLEYLEGSVSVPVSMANVWANAFSLDEYIPQMQISESLEYSTAIGLAIRDAVDPLW
jgi:type IV pilus assembly protein PilM